MNQSALTMTLLTLVSLPAMAFWVERVAASQIWYRTNPGILGNVLGVIAPSWFWLPPLFLVQVIIIVAGWKSLGLAGRVVAALLLFVPVPAIVLPFLISFGRT